MKEGIFIVIAISKKNKTVQILNGYTSKNTYSYKNYKDLKSKLNLSIKECLKNEKEELDSE